MSFQAQHFKSKWFLHLKSCCFLSKEELDSENLLWTAMWETCREYREANDIRHTECGNLVCQHPDFVLFADDVVSQYFASHVQIAAEGQKSNISESVGRKEAYSRLLSLHLGELFFTIDGKDTEQTAYHKAAFVLLLAAVFTVVAERELQIKALNLLLSLLSDPLLVVTRFG